MNGKYCPLRPEYAVDVNVPLFPCLSSLPPPSPPRQGVAVHPEDPRYKKFQGKTLIHPFTGRKIPVILDSILVDMEKGTGAVKVKSSVGVGIDSGNWSSVACGTAAVCVTRVYWCLADFVMQRGVTSAAVIDRLFVLINDCGDTCLLFLFFAFHVVPILSSLSLQYLLHG